MFDFLTVGKTLKKFGDELQEVQGQIEDTLQKIEDVQYAPACMADVILALEVWAKSNHVRYQDYLKTTLAGLVNTPHKLGDAGHVNGVLSFRGIAPEPSAFLPISRDIQLCGLLGPARFVDLMRTQLDSLDWRDSGLPVADRLVTIAALEKKLNALRTKEADLLKSAEKAGISIA